MAESAKERSGGPAPRAYALHSLAIKTFSKPTNHVQHNFPQTEMSQFFKRWNR